MPVSGLNGRVGLTLKKGAEGRDSWGPCGVMANCQDKNKRWGSRVAQSVKHPTLDLSSGRDLTARGFEPLIWLCADSAEPAWNSLSLPLSASSPLTHTFSLSFK